MKTKGKLIVIEGSDGSGKATQAGLLIDYCKAQHVPYASVDFPQYYKTFFGKWVGRFLKGEFGDAKAIPPYIVSIPYAADRFQAKQDMEFWLNEGKIVIANRYAGSNAAYQSARLPKKEREKFVLWNFEMEYEAFGIPREDVVIFLYVPFAISQNLIEQKNTRKYLGKSAKKDINESNLQLLQEVEQVYLDFCKRFPHWIKIDCVKNGQMLTKDDIHQKVLEALRRKKIIS